MSCVFDSGDLLLYLGIFTLRCFKGLSSFYGWGRQVKEISFSIHQASQSSFKFLPHRWHRVLLLFRNSAQIRIRCSPFWVQSPSGQTEPICSTFSRNLYQDTVEHLDSSHYLAQPYCRAWAAASIDWWNESLRGIHTTFWDHTHCESRERVIGAFHSRWTKGQGEWVSRLQQG